MLHFVQLSYVMLSDLIFCSGLFYLFLQHIYVVIRYIM